MEKKIIDLIYTTRTLCESLRDRIDINNEDELWDYLDEVEACLEELVNYGEDD